VLAAAKCHVFFEEALGQQLWLSFLNDSSCAGLFPGNLLLQPVLSAFEFFWSRTGSAFVSVLLRNQLRFEMDKIIMKIGYWVAVTVSDRMIGSVFQWHSAS
jgi:hypothetical protein